MGKLCNILIGEHSTSFTASNPFSSIIKGIAGISYGCWEHHRTADMQFFKKLSKRYQRSHFLLQKQDQEAAAVCACDTQLKRLAKLPRTHNRSNLACLADEI